MKKNNGSCIVLILACFFQVAQYVGVIMLAVSLIMGMLRTPNVVLMWASFGLWVGGMVFYFILAVLDKVLYGMEKNNEQRAKTEIQ